ncbi:MAG: hypothetical protein WC791_01010 [Candidatus Paceibacterota bacterium]|jgi:uncharacterized membrane protein YgcG
MAIHQVNHPRWGSNLANQLTASVQTYGEDGHGYKTVTVPRVLLGGTKQKKILVGFISRPAVDNECADRNFRHRCGLLKITMTPGGRNGPIFTVFLDGHVASNFVSHEIEFRFAPEELQENVGDPVAEVWFRGKGDRRGPLKEYSASRIVCTFADKEQMEKHLDVTSRQMPRSITSKGVVYHSTGSGHYQSNDGSMLPSLAVIYFLLSPSEQQAFAAQNPEVQSFVSDTSQEVSMGDGGTFGEASADGGDFGGTDGGAPSDGSDGGSGSDGGGGGGD